MTTDDAREITMTYRNYRGEVSKRTVKPVRIYWGSTDWHPEPGWLMEAWDYEKNASRDFALKDCVFYDFPMILLKRWMDTSREVDCSSGVCCCGDSMENHADPMCCGHSPVDSGTYVVDRLREQTYMVLGSRLDDEERI